ncbi:MAG: rRNA pseudouridine synthase [Opitutales bacterium]|nr:rRNA pseudouridine synthase [Opitutales bacterium]
MDAPKERIRLQKYLSQAEVCSRRAAETLITNGEITVNGEIAELGQTVVPGEDDVRLNGKKITLESRSRIVLMMNKPRGYVCTNLDPHNAQTVFQLIPPEYAAHKLFCVGRLDKDSEGLLLITNDGELANNIIHPSSNILKRYEVTLNRDFDPALTPRLLKGVKLKNENDEDEFLQFANIVRFPDSRKLEIHLKQGRKREIRRLFEVFGFFVKTLVRFQIGGLILKKMPAGDCRKLSQKEIDSIFAKGGNASPKHSGLKKPNRAALRGEKAMERKTSTHKKISTRTALRERDAQKLRERAKAQAQKRARPKPVEETDVEFSENAFAKKRPEVSRENVWQRGIRPHHKNARTRNYASRKKRN